MRMASRGEMALSRCGARNDPRMAGEWRGGFVIMSGREGDEFYCAVELDLN